MLLLWCAGYAAALDPHRLSSQYVHDHYGREEGLPPGAVWAVLQSRDGYLWLGTQNGLVRFDGVEARVFNSDNSPGLASHDVRGLMQAANGDLWLGTYGGGAARYRNGEFKTFGPDDGLAHAVVYDIHQADDGTIWFGTGGGVSRLGTDGEITTLTARDGPVARYVFDVYQDRSGALWFASLVAGVSRWMDGEITRYTREDGLASDQVNRVFQDRQGTVWLGTYDGGFHRMTAAGPQAVSLPEGAAGNGIQSIFEDRDGNLWLGTYGRGLIRINDGRAVPFDKGPLADAMVFDMIEDREGSLWLATRDGLHRLGNGKFLNFGAPEGLAHATFAVTFDPGSETLWTGTEGAGVFRMQGGEIEQFTSDHGLISDNISALTPDGRGGLWVGSFGGGLNHLAADGSVRTWTREDGLPSNHLFALLMGPGDKLWVAGEGGVGRMEEDGFTTWSQEEGLPDPLVRQMHFDRDGQLWVGRNGGGLARFDGRQFEHFAGKERGPGNFPYAFHEDAQGRLWIGSRDSGLSLYRDDEFHRFSTDAGLPQSSVYGIEEDNRGNLWLSGVDGLMRVPSDELLAFADGRTDSIEAELFDEADGLRSAQFTGGFQPGVARDDQGRLWFPSLAGLAMVDPKRVQPNPVPPPVLIKRVVVDGEPVGTDGAIDLPAGADNLEIHYTALSLVAPSEVRFRYRLQGYKDQWQDVAARRTAYYTRLPPGSYRFEVMGSNNDGVWSNSAAGMTIVQEPFIWQTAWFRVLVAVAVLLLAALVYWLNVRQFRVREQRLSNLVRERTGQLEEALAAVERSSRIDGLTGVANRGYFEERLAQEWARARREREPLGLVLADIDHFKLLNDSRGHQVGDDFLREVAGALVSVIRRPGDLVARYGGEEFVVLLPGTDAESVRVLAERMRAGVEALDLSHPDGGISGRITISAGAVAITPDGQVESRVLVERADRALYSAKNAGRNRVSAASGA